MEKSILLLISSALSLVMILGSKVWASGIPIKVSQLDDTLHIEFIGITQNEYQLKKKEHEIEVQLLPLNSEAIKKLQQIKSNFLEKIEVNEKGPDQKHVILFKTPKKEIESFDYLTDNPHRLIIDFFKSEKKEKKVESNNDNKSQSKVVAQKKLPEKEKKDADRSPASEDVLVLDSKGNIQSNVKSSMEELKNIGRIFDLGDTSLKRFEIQDYEIHDESIIASKENVYLDFPMIKAETNQLTYLTTHQPIYEIIPKETEENKQARLILTLFENKRYNVLLKTIDWFLVKFPNSEYDEIIRLIWADTYFSLWLDKRNVNDFDVAMIRYKQAIQKYPNSLLAERTQLLIGYATLDRGDYLNALKILQDHLFARPDSSNAGLIKLAIAETYLKLNRFEEAMKIYHEIETSAKDKSEKLHAAYLKGNVYSQKKDYERAIAEYRRVLAVYPQGKTTHPNALYNYAAAYFSIGKYKESLNYYREFLQNFSNHPYVPYAMTRIGELMEILGASKDKVLGTYLETYFRYGEESAAIVARLRILSNRMIEMKEKEILKATEDIIKLAEKSTLEGIDQFATLMLAEGYSKRNDYDKSLELLIKYYQDHPTTANTKLLSKRIEKNINDKILLLVNQGKFIQALKTHSKYADNWLKSSERIDTKYNIARAYEQAGVYQQSEILYRDIMNKIYSLKGTQAEKERNVFENLPSTDVINLRLASIASQNNQFAQSYDYLKNITNPEKLSEDQQIERVYLSAQILNKKGDLETATRYLSEILNIWKGQPALVVEPYFLLGEMELKQGKTQDALRTFQLINKMMGQSKDTKPEIQIRALEQTAEIFLNTKKTEEAILTLEKLLTRYEATHSLDAFRYKVGKLYFQQGEIKKASTIWNELKNKKNIFWYQMAQEQLKNSEWENEYKKYLKRIPAMSNEGTTQ